MAYDDNYDLEMQEYLENNQDIMADGIGENEMLDETADMTSDKYHNHAVQTARERNGIVVSAKSFIQNRRDLKADYKAAREQQKAQYKADRAQYTADFINQSKDYVKNKAIDTVDYIGQQAQNIKNYTSEKATSWLSRAKEFSLGVARGAARNLATGMTNVKNIRKNIKVNFANKYNGAIDALNKFADASQSVTSDEDFNVTNDVVVE